MNWPKPSPGNINCQSCRRPNVSGHQLCNRCERCGCTCRRCSSCLATHSRRFLCHSCGLCKKQSVRNGLASCQCKRHPKRGYLVTQRPGQFLLQTKGKKLNNLNRALGLEIELSRVPEITTPFSKIRRPGFLNFRYEHDGSISAGGQEMVVSPMIKDQFVTGLKYLTDLFATGGAQVNLTCGYHVHVDVIDFSAFDLRRLMMLYRQYESLFYDLVRPNRDQPQRGGANGRIKAYCARWGFPEEFYARLATQKTGKTIRQMLIDALYPEQRNQGHGRNNHRFTPMDSIKAHKYQPCRYFGLNFHSFYERGTVEFRHHEGSIDNQTLLNWGLLCGWFVELASQLSNKHISELQSIEQLLQGRWYLHNQLVGIPESVGEWVRTTLARRLTEREKLPKIATEAGITEATIAQLVAQQQGRYRADLRVYEQQIADRDRIARVQNQTVVIHDTIEEQEIEDDREREDDVYRNDDDGRVTDPDTDPF